jgi:hypothetical protein
MTSGARRECLAGAYATTTDAHAKARTIRCNFSHPDFNRRLWNFTKINRRTKLGLSPYFGSSGRGL